MNTPRVSQAQKDALLRQAWLREQAGLIRAREDHELFTYEDLWREAVRQTQQEQARWKHQR